MAPADPKSTSKDFKELGKQCCSVGIVFTITAVICAIIVFTSAHVKYEVSTCRIITIDKSPASCANNCECSAIVQVIYNPNNMQYMTTTGNCTTSESYLAPCCVKYVKDSSGNMLFDSINLHKDDCTAPPKWKQNIPTMILGIVFGVFTCVFCMCGCCSCHTAETMEKEEKAAQAQRLAAQPAAQPAQPVAQPVAQSVAQPAPVDVLGLDRQNASSTSEAISIEMYQDNSDSDADDRQKLI
jgi:hypothetical protein